MSDLWIININQKKIDQIIGHRVQKKKIIDWLKNKRVE